MSDVAVRMKLSSKQAGKLYMKCSQLEEEAKRLQRDAGRYQFLRDEDNWGEDSGDDWGLLGESHGEEFDRIIDDRLEASADNDGSGFDDAM